MPGFAPGYGAPQGGTPSAAGAFNESSLPDWLREATAGQPPFQPPFAPAASPFVSGLAPSPTPGPATPYPQQYGTPAALSGYHAGGQPGGSLAANALFDAGALPTWLGGTGNSGQPAQPATPLSGEGLQVSSLVDERALPIWLRQEPEAPPAQTPQPGSVSRWLSAPVTEETMPPVLNQVYGAAQIARTPTPPAPPGYWGAAAPPAAPPLPGAVPSAQLVDDSALPQWLRAQADSPAASPPVGPSAAPGYQPPAAYGVGSSGAGATAWGGYSPHSAMEPQAQVPAPSSAPAGSFAASDLIEPSAMPAWVQQGGAPPQPSFSSATGWTGQHVAAGPVGVTGVHQGVAMNPGWDAAAMSAPADGASLPSWLQAPNAAAEPGGTGAWTAAQGAVRRGRESMIPPAELPPWLREGTANEPAPDYAAPAYAAPAPQPTATDQQWDELQRDWGGDESDHYVDRFGVEEPSMDRPFSMEYDHQQRAAGGATDYTGEQRAQAPDRGKGKRKRFGR
jgi:hypothetical protein